MLATLKNNVITEHVNSSTQLVHGQTKLFQLKLSETMSLTKG